MAVEGFQYSHACETGVVIVLSGQLGVWGKGKKPQMCTLGLSVSVGILCGYKPQEQKSFVLLDSMKFSHFFLCLFSCSAWNKRLKL